MVDADFVSYFLDVMLKNYFFSKRKMAHMLGVTLRTVQTVFQKMPQQKGASLVFVNAICYCYKNHISVDAIYEQYNNEVKKHNLLISRLTSRSGLAKQIGRSASGTTYSLCKIFHLPPLSIISQNIPDNTLHLEVIEMSFEHISVTRQLINAALKHHFSSDLQLMSTTLACDPSDLSNALTVDGSRKSAIIFERLSSYCITHNLSLDILRDDCIHS